MRRACWCRMASHAAASPAKQRSTKCCSSAFRASLDASVQSARAGRPFPSSDAGRSIGSSDRSSALTLKVNEIGRMEVPRRSGPGPGMAGRPRAGERSLPPQPGQHGFIVEEAKLSRPLRRPDPSPPGRVMSKRRIILTIIGLGVLIGVGWHQIHTSPEWKNFTWEAVWSATQEAKLGFIAGAVVLIYASYLLRSLRWRALMTPHGKFWPVLKGTLIGFTGIAFFGRPGELLRPYYIARKHATSVAPQLAVWLLERAFDMGATLVLVLAALLLSPGLASGEDAASVALRHAVWLLAVAGIALFHKYSQRILARLRGRFARGGRRMSQRLEHFLHTLAAGTKALSRRRNLLVSSFYTLSMSMGVAVAVWLIVRGYPGMLPGFSYGEALVLLGFLLVGSIVQLPAIGGGVQVLLILGLTEVFGAPAAPAASASLLMWLVAFYAVAPLGAALAAREGISWKAMEHEAELASR